MKPFSMPELPPVLTDMQRRISEFMGSHSATDLQGPLRQALESALQRMDLVTREEFAQQQRLLALAEEKIAALVEQDSKTSADQWNKWIEGAKAL